jgi:hypothetical protein
MAPWKSYLENSMERRVTQQVQRAIVRPSLSRVGSARQRGGQWGAPSGGGGNRGADGTMQQPN